MRVYEEYESAKEKRKAQRESAPLGRRRITGKAKGYVLIFNEDGNSITSGFAYGGYGSIISLDAGDKPHGGVGSVNATPEYLRENCRLVGFEYIPKEWQKVFAYKLQHWLTMDEDSAKSPSSDKYRRLMKIARI